MLSDVYIWKIIIFSRVAQWLYKNYVKVPTQRKKYLRHINNILLAAKDKLLPQILQWGGITPGCNLNDLKDPGKAGHRKLR